MSIVSKIRKSAQGESCTLRLDGCKDNQETVVFCHLNTPYKGIGLKSPDLFGVYGCYHCHTLLDAHKATAEDKLRALIETQYRLIQKGLINV